MNSYNEALRAAVTMARTHKQEVGLERNPLFGNYSVFLLPRPENRSGHELRCEVVRPSDPMPEAA